MGFLDALKAWSFKICISKLLKRGLRVGLAWAGSSIPDSYGISINQAEAFAALWALIEGGSNVMKVKLENTTLSWISKYLL